MPNVNFSDVNRLPPKTTSHYPKFVLATGIGNSPTDRLRVAIVAWQALPAVFPHLGSRVGGIETAAWTLAKGLATQTRWSPDLVFRSPSKLPTSMLDGVNLIASIERWEAVRRDVSECIDFSARRWKRFRWSLFWNLPLLAITRPLRRRDPELMQPDPRLQSLRPDVWVAMGVGKESAGVIATARSQDRPSVLMIRSGADLDSRFLSDEITLTDYGERSDVCRFAIQNATRVVCQTQTQQAKLKSLFDRDSFLVRNPIDLPRWQPAESDSRRGVLWVGRYEHFAKRISMAIEIARTCPELPFTLIANRDDPRVETLVRKGCPKNVTLVDYVPPTEMSQRFGDAAVFLSTSSSSAEGFPNVLLQAAASQTPIVSLEDFDGFIKSSGAGFVCGGKADIAVEKLRSIVSQNESVDHKAVMDYLRRHHDWDEIIRQFDKALTF